MTPIERFWNGVDRKGPEECWPFLGANMVSWDGRPQQKRRVAWIVTYGRIPKGKMALVKCGTGSCCNPSHLFLGKHKERSAVMAKFGRSTTGEKCHNAKLTEEDVRDIRKRFVRTSYHKTNAAELAREKGVLTGAIHAIVRGEYWKHVA